MVKTLDCGPRHTGSTPVLHTKKIQKVLDKTQEISYNNNILIEKLSCFNGRKTIQTPLGCCNGPPTTQVKQWELQEQLCKLQVRVEPHKLYKRL